MSVILGVKRTKCDHIEGEHTVNMYEGHWTIRQLYFMRHPPGTGSKTDPVATDAKGRVLSLNITLTDLKGCDITEISFKCQETADLVDNKLGDRKWAQICFVKCFCMYGQYSSVTFVIIQT